MMSNQNSHSDRIILAGLQDQLNDLESLNVLRARTSGNVKIESLSLNMARKRVNLDLNLPKSIKKEVTQSSQMKFTVD